MGILGNHHHGKECREVFKRRGELKNVLCWCDYSGQVVSSFTHKIQPGYYVVNILVSIEGIVLYHFSASQLHNPLAASSKLSRHAMFYSFFLMTEKRMLQPYPHRENTLFNF